jgi:aspartate-semialdehyde dehydrogenase
MKTEMPAKFADMTVIDASNIDAIAGKVSFVFCAVDMKKDEIRALEEAYAKAEIPVVSNNSAHRWTPDVPMVIPEINPEHLEVIKAQRERLGTRRGFIAVKPNCSIQAYVPELTPLRKYGIKEVVATTYQAISGAGKTFNEWPEMIDNIIPFIGGEEEKSEQEPLRVWGKVENGEIVKTTDTVITTQCIRVPVTDGHTAAVFVRFENKPTKEQILEDWKNFKGLPQELGLPHAPEQFITYFEEDNRPQAKLDRDIYGGMGVTAGRLREDTLYDYKFVGLSHNTLRGAAGGAVLIAELLYRLGYFD